MQIKLNQFEIQQALTEFLQRRSSSKITLTAFDLKGMRSEEGYHANVEVEYEDVSYEEVVPKLVSFAKESTGSGSTSKEKHSEPEMSEESRKVVFTILNLMQTNVNHSNTARILDMIDTGSEEVQNYFYDSTMIAELRNTYEITESNQVVEEEVPSEEGSEDSEPDLSEPTVEEEPPFDTEPEKEETEVSSVAETKTAPLTNLFGVVTQPNTKEVVVEKKATKKLFQFN